MSKFQLRPNTNFALDVSVRESDAYSESVYLRFEHCISPENISGMSEVFMTPLQLEMLGKFLIRRADEIRTEQAVRKDPI
jgi:hypothetical protein